MLQFPELLYRTFVSYFVPFYRFLITRWKDNAKKWIESGKFGGKGSNAHKAGVVGDTAGDPMKDTAGPSLNIMLKLMSVISLMLAPVLMHFSGLI